MVRATAPPVWAAVVMLMPVRGPGHAGTVDDQRVAGVAAQHSAGLKRWPLAGYRGCSGNCHGQDLLGHGIRDSALAEVAVLERGNECKAHLFDECSGAAARDGGFCGGEAGGE
jgi:hypothetical protein